MLVSPFISSLAVETWDAWFRWREGGRLRDLTIDATWDRVANSLVQAEAGSTRGHCKRRLLDAFGKWQLLMDERILATAGTTANAWPADDLAAVLNVAAFIKAPCTPQAAFMQDAFEETAGLAVRALDNAIQITTPSPSWTAGLRIGMIGVADALALLGIAYDSAEARELVVAVTRALADGCLRGSVATSRDRGSRLSGDGGWHQQQQMRGTPAGLLADASRYGLRFRQLTAITPQRRIAWLANDVSDALDPLRSRPCALAFECANGGRCIQSDGYAHALSRQLGTILLAAPAPEATSMLAQLKLRAAAQNWIDQPISYPLPLEQAPDADTVTASGVIATEYGLGAPSWRHCDADARV